MYRYKWYTIPITLQVQFRSNFHTKPNHVRSRLRCRGCCAYIDRVLNLHKSLRLVGIELYCIVLIIGCTFTLY